MQLLNELASAAFSNHHVGRDQVLSDSRAFPDLLKDHLATPVSHFVIILFYAGKGRIKNLAFPHVIKSGNDHVPGKLIAHQHQLRRCGKRHNVICTDKGIRHSSFFQNPMHGIDGAPVGPAAIAHVLRVKREPMLLKDFPGNLHARVALRMSGCPADISDPLDAMFFHDVRDKIPHSRMSVHAYAGHARILHADTDYGNAFLFGILKNGYRCLFRIDHVGKHNGTVIILYVAEFINV